ncbi:MAG: hypothetical protein LBJ00_10745 [Planctomycetaceae bacterium]|nr:hypothetical protein [Planctomycetaceae bacterium]
MSYHPSFYIPKPVRAKLAAHIPTPAWAVGFALEQPLHVVALACSVQFREFKVA